MSTSANIGNHNNVIFAPLLIDDAEEAGQLCYSAFYDNPLYNSIFGFDEKQRQQDAMTWLFQRRIQVLLDAGATFVKSVDSQTGRIVGCGGIYGPNNHPSTWVKIQRGLLLWPFLWGYQTLSKALEIDRRFTTSKSGPLSQGFQLALVCISPSNQGVGLGRSMMKHLLAPYVEKQADPPGNALEFNTGIWLETQKESNIKFYSNLGFKLVKEEKVDYGIEFTTYTMANDFILKQLMTEKDPE